ncbi:MAG TPA: hypothetical protein VL325_07125 [Pyrinomonadaceae bacterium]|nr:hypothetical protein [Pyrinomonadaceae bacterium]
MITAVDTKLRFKQEPQWWKIALMDFVDDFRRHEDPAAIEQPFPLDDERQDAVLAGVIESLCDEINIEVPGWLDHVPACREPYFVAGLENLKAIAIVESPLRFRIRKVFVLENFLSRV